MCCATAAHPLTPAGQKRARRETIWSISCKPSSYMTSHVQTRGCVHASAMEHELPWTIHSIPQYTLPTPFSLDLGPNCRSFLGYAISWLMYLHSVPQYTLPTPFSLDLDCKRLHQARAHATDCLRHRTAQGTASSEQGLAKAPKSD